MVICEANTSKITLKECGLPATTEFDGMWFCEKHTNEVQFGMVLEKQLKESLSGYSITNFKYGDYRHD